MTNREWLKTLTNDQFAEWLEDFAEGYVCFWILHYDMCDFSHRDDDKEIQLNWLNSEHNNEFKF